MARFIFLLLCVGIGLSACGKSDIDVYEASKEKSAPSPMAASESPEAPTPSPIAVAIGDELHWTLPAGWKALPGSGMRYATIVVPGKGSPGAELSVVVLPGSAGGELSNVNRWRGQLGLDPVDERGLPANSRRLKTVAGMLLLVQYEGSQDGKKTGFLGAILSSGDKTWFFKLTGDPSTVGSARSAFDEFLKSLRPSAS